MQRPKQTATAAARCAKTTPGLKSHLIIASQSRHCLLAVWPDGESKGVGATGRSIPPHPDPLPKGEGESSAGFRHIGARGLPDDARKTRKVGAGAPTLGWWPERLWRSGCGFAATIQPVVRPSDWALPWAYFLLAPTGRQPELSQVGYDGLCALYDFNRCSHPERTTRRSE